MPLIDELQQTLIPFDAGPHAVFRTVGHTYVRDNLWMDILQFGLPMGTFSLDIAADWNAWNGAYPNFRIFDYTNATVLWDGTGQTSMSPCAVTTTPIYLPSETMLELHVQGCLHDNSLEIHQATVQAHIWSPGWPFNLGPRGPRTWHQRLLDGEFDED